MSIFYARNLELDIGKVTISNMPKIFSMNIYELFISTLFIIHNIHILNQICVIWNEENLLDMTIVNNYINFLLRLSLAFWEIEWFNDRLIQEN